jgi:hypothetical protein
MENQAFTHLCYTLDSALSVPDEALSFLRVYASPDLKEAIAVLLHALAARPDALHDLRVQEALAMELTASPSVLDRSVGDAILWSLPSRRRRKKTSQ